MAACFQLECDFDCNDMKLERANGRAASLWKKRCAYQRSIEQKSRTFRQLSKAPNAGNPHRAARSATRTCVAQGNLAVDADMPSISFASKPWRKPSIVNRINQTSNELDEAETTATDGSEYSDVDFDEVCNSAPCEAQTKQGKKKKKVSFDDSFEVLNDDTSDEAAQLLEVERRRHEAEEQARLLACCGSGRPVTRAAKIAKAAALKLKTEEELRMKTAAEEEIDWAVLDEVSANDFATDGEWALA